MAAADRCSADQEWLSDKVTGSAFGRRSLPQFGTTRKCSRARGMTGTGGEPDAARKSSIRLRRHRRSPESDRTGDGDCGIPAGRGFRRCTCVGYMAAALSASDLILRHHRIVRCSGAMTIVTLADFDWGSDISLRKPDEAPGARLSALVRKVQRITSLP